MIMGIRILGLNFKNFLKNLLRFIPPSLFNIEDTQVMACGIEFRRTCDNLLEIIAGFFKLAQFIVK